MCRKFGLAIGVLNQASARPTEGEGEGKEEGGEGWGDEIITWSFAPFPRCDRFN